MTAATATATWVPSIALSVAVHTGAAALVLAMLDPRPVLDTPLPKSELRIETQAVAQSTATAAEAAGEVTQTASAKGATLSQGMVPQSRAEATRPAAERLGAVAAAAQTTKPAAAPGQKLTASAAPPAAKADVPQTTALRPAPATSAPLAAAYPTGAALPEVPPATTAVPQRSPDLHPAIAAPADGEHMVASLAFSGEDAQIDPVSLKAIQSFMQPGDTAAQSDDTHDALAAILSSVPCSRLQAEFNPETGSLDLRGHVPDAAMKGPVLAALQAQLGSTIKVNDAMLILPRPQCGALGGIADVGLPQSQDQLTNPRLIGADAQARAYDYRRGETLVLDLAAPDYDAFVYVDYFSADGNVIHLVPNDTVALQRRPAGSAMRVGAPDADEPFLNITIGPPYGQEIAAAFAASAPLYDGVRPLSEPAGPYLDWLKDQVTAARAADPDFKGEWVYFFVSTAE